MLLLFELFKKIEKIIFLINSMILLVGWLESKIFYEIQKKVHDLELRGSNVFFVKSSLRIINKENIFK